MLKYVMQVIGVALVLSGGLWALQGLGLVRWPEDSFMLAQSEWAIYGTVTAAVGVLLFWLARKKA